MGGPGDGAFGRTAVLLQSTMRVERLGSPEGSELQLLRLQPRAKLVGGLDERSFQCLDHATRILFNGPGRVPIAEVRPCARAHPKLRRRRPVCAQAAGRLCSGGSGVVAAAKLDPAARLQSLSVKQWCRLARALDAWPHWEGPHA